jgi:hypothetical protein
MITPRHTTLRKAPLDEGSVYRRGLYLYNTQHSQEMCIYANVGIRTRIPKNRATADPHLSLRSAFVRNNIPWALWLNTCLPSLGTPERSTVTSIRESEYHVPCVNVWSGIVYLWHCRAPILLRDGVRDQWYFIFMESALSRLLEVVYLASRWSCGLSTMQLHHTTGKECNSGQMWWI